MNTFRSEYRCDRVALLRGSAISRVRDVRSSTHGCVLPTRCQAFAIAVVPSTDPIRNVKSNKDRFRDLLSRVMRRGER